MTMAKECDVCEELYKVEPGVIELEVSIKSAKPEDLKKDLWQSWSEVDLCLTCSKKLLAMIGRALEGL